MRLAALLAITGAVGAVGAVACSRPPPLTSCGDDLRGVYAEADQRWMILDAGDTLEAYPLFPDVPAAAGLEVAPRLLRLARAPDGTVAGEVVRRYMRGARACLGKQPARLTACAGDTLELVLADPPPPIAWEPACAWGRPAASRRERWIRAAD